MLAHSTLLRLVTGSIAALTLLAGCQTLDDAGRVIDGADLVNDLAARLDRSGELTYSADYQLPGGESATIAQAQEPPRAAYTYPGGKLTVTRDGTVECSTTGARPTCTRTLPQTSSTKPSVEVFASARERGLVTPTVVIGLLTAAALDPRAIIEQTDTTIAGRHAICVRVTELANAAASSFDACITNDGVLGSFDGVVDGRPAELAMSRYRDAVETTAFDQPAGATLVDRRPPRK